MLIRLTTGAALASCLAAAATRTRTTPASDSARGASACPRGGSSGGAFSLSARVEGAFALSFDPAGIRLEAAMLLRGQRDWARDAAARAGAWPPDVPRRPGDLAPSLNGATVDTFAVVYDRANDIAWIGGRRVAMEGANVVLLDRADGVGGSPVVVARLRVPSRVPTTGSICAMADPRRGAELAALLTANPTIRAFVDP